MTGSTALSNSLGIAGAILGTAGAVLLFGGRFSGLLLLASACLICGGSLWVRSGRRRAVSVLVRAMTALMHPAAGVGLAMVVGGLVMLATGFHPLKSYQAMLYGGLVKNWHVSVLNAVPLIFTGLSVALAFRGGLFNIGAEGQYYVGTMMAVWLGIRLNLPSLVVIPLIFVMGAAAGAVYNAVPAWLKIKTGAHEVVTTMMFAYIARTLSSLFIRFNGGNPADSRHPYITDPVLQPTWLPSYNSFLPEANYRLHVGILIAVLTAILVHGFLFRTRAGFEIRAVGLNRNAARTQGISVGRIVMLTMLLSGALAALAGVTQVLGLDRKMFGNLNAGYGWNGIAVALLAGNSPIGVIFAALLWGILDAGGQYMARTIQTPTSIVEIIKGMILFLILARHLFSYFKRTR